MEKYDYVIVGQGISGTLLAQAFMEKDQKIMVIDKGHRQSASSIAAGIINPITGRRFVKSWKIDEFLPFAKMTYQKIEALLGAKYFYDRQVLRILFSNSESNEWSARTAQPGWIEYVEETNTIGEFESHIFPGTDQGILLGAQVKLYQLILDYRNYLLKRNQLIEAPISSTDVNLETSTIPKLNINFQNIVFAEGANGGENPFFDFVPFEPAKGEVFHLRIPGLKTERLLKHKMMMAPIEDDLFWFGSNYEWNASDGNPSEEGKRFLQKRLDMMLPKYEIVNHLGAIRPTIKDRRPVLGRHPELNNVLLFNGLGTKGASLGPNMADWMSDYCLSDKPLDPLVDIKRFVKN